MDIIHFIVIFTCLKTVNGAGYIEIGNLPASVSVFIEDPGSTYLHTFTLYKSSSVGTVTCSFNPANTNFALTQNGGQYHIETAVTPTLTVGTVDLDIDCATAGVTTIAGTLSVTVIPNTPPVYPNGTDFGTVAVSVKTGKADHVILTLQYADNDTTSPLPHQTILSTAPTPVTTLFSLQSDQLKLVTDMLAYDDEAQYEVEIEIGDERTTSTGTVTVNIIDRNTVPEFVLGVNTSVSIHLPEFTAGRYPVYDIDVYDADGDAVYLTEIYNDPNKAAFDIVESTGEIFLIGGNVLDYETINMYIFHVTIEDYIEVQTTSTFSVTVFVDDINEQPTYNVTPTAITIDEAPMNTIVGTLDGQCSDPDGDNITYAILFSLESSYFSIDPDTAQVSLAADFDYDDPNLANEVNLTIRCSDGKGLYDDTVYSITISDINDNNPICNPAVTSFSLDYAQVVNDTIVNVDCTDADSTINAELEYSTIGFDNGYSTTYFHVDTSGNVSIFTDFLMDFNTSFYVTILITDRGTPSLSATVTLTITYTERPTIVRYDRIDECFLCTTSAITLVSVACLFVFIIIVYISVLIILRCCHAVEKWRIRRALTKKEKKKTVTKWRWCGCLRPGKLKKAKRSAREIVAAKMKDAEYMRARDALQGKHDPTLGINTITNTSTSESKRKPPKGPPKKGKVRLDVPSTSAAGDHTMDYMKRDKTPDLSATPIDRSALTSSQKVHIEQFKAAKDVRSTATKKQAASDMVWTFQGRNK